MVPDTYCWRTWSDMWWYKGLTWPSTYEDQHSSCNTFDGFWQVTLASPIGMSVSQCTMKWLEQIKVYTLGFLASAAAIAAEARHSEGQLTTLSCKFETDVLTHLNTYIRKCSVDQDWEKSKESSQCPRHALILFRNQSSTISNVEPQFFFKHTYLNKRAFVRSIRISCLENDEDSNGGYFTWVEPITKSDAITRHATQIQYDTQDDDPDDGQDLDTCKPKLHFPYF